MSESYQEQCPLLNEELLEEDKFSPRYHKRFRPMVYKGRARNNARGAAAIMRLWPEYWSSSVTYWWIALGMIGLITIIVYNSVVVFAMLPPANFKETRLRTAQIAIPIHVDATSTLNVYMHLFVDSNQVVDLNFYMPYIDVLANKYPDYEYHFVIVRNDTTIESNNLSAEDNNAMALNLLWTKNSVHHSENNNIVIEQVLLSKYMDSSPLRKYWKKMPNQFTEFLIRAVSIWDRGGIAFNPIILTPKSPQVIYKEKVKNILKDYCSDSKDNVIVQHKIKNKHDGRKKKVNNIRDIIEALEHDDSDYNSLPIMDSDYKYNSQDKNSHSKLPLYPVHSTTNNTIIFEKVHPKFKKIVENKSSKFKASGETLIMAETNINNTSMPSQNEHSTNATGFLNMFDFLLQNKSNPENSNNFHDELKTVTRKRKHVLEENMKDKKDANDGSFDYLKNIKNATFKTVFTANSKQHSENGIEVNIESDDLSNQFTIDLKGNIVSSKIPCHAFLGTMFSNAIHHTEESLTDFIIAELSIFCKGTLSSCKGIDVILL